MRKPNRTRTVSLPPFLHPRQAGWGSYSWFLLQKPSCFLFHKCIFKPCYLSFDHILMLQKNSVTLFSQCICLSLSSLLDLTVISFPLSPFYIFFNVISCSVFVYIYEVFRSFPGNILKTALACPYSDIDHVCTWKNSVGPSL